MQHPRYGTLKSDCWVCGDVMPMEAMESGRAVEADYRRRGVTTMRTFNGSYFRGPDSSLDAIDTTTD